MGDPRRPPRPAPGGHALVAGALLRPAHRDRAGRGRHVWDSEGNRYLDFFAGILTDDRPRAARGHPGGERAGGQGPAHLDALPHRPRSSWPSASPPCRASPTPRSSSPPAAPRPPTPPCCWPPPTAGPTRCWPCATATTGGRSPPWASPATAAGRPPACRRSTPSTSTAATAAAARSPASATTRSPPPASPTSRTSSPRRRPATWPASSPSRSRAWAGSPCRPTRCSGRSRTCSTATASCGSATRSRRDGAHRRPLLGLAGAHADGQSPDLMTFAKGLGNGLSIGGVVATRRCHGLPARQLDLDLRGQPGDHGGALANLDYLLDHDRRATPGGSAACSIGACGARAPRQRGRRGAGARA